MLSYKSKRKGYYGVTFLYDILEKAKLQEQRTEATEGNLF